MYTVPVTHLVDRPMLTTIVAQTRPSYSGQPIMPMSGTPPPGAKSPTLSKVNHRTPPVNRQLSTSGPPSKRPSKARSKWHFGIRSRCPPWEVMLEIFKSLKNVGFVSICSK